MYKIYFTFIFSLTVNAMTFDRAVELIRKHNSVASLQAVSKAQKEISSAKGSWGDPMFMVSAMNLPKDSLNRDENAMTGIQFGLSQKISLTNKYGNLENSSLSLSESTEYDALNIERELIRSLWNNLILKRSLIEEREILKENIIWLSNILKVSKKLYVNGKVSQSAILEIEIRKSEVDMKLNDSEYELKKVEDNLKYLIGESFSSIDKETIPWSLINTQDLKVTDFKELSLQSKIRAKELALSAANKNYVPDVTVSLAYTKRANIDGKGDFVGASISFPLPFSSEKYSKKDSAVQEKYSVLKSYENYKKKKEFESSIVEREILKVEKDLSIINEKTLKYAQNSREITAKSYSNGSSTYVELLQSELKLQEILILKSDLMAKRDTYKVALKYIRGEKLSE